MKLYCQGCGASFEDNPVNAFPVSCATCGGGHWATWEPGHAPAIVGMSVPITPANVTASQFTLTVPVRDPTGTAGAR